MEHLNHGGIAWEVWLMSFGEAFFEGKFRSMKVYLQYYISIVDLL